MGNKSGKEKKGKIEEKYTDVDSPSRINVCNEIIQTEENYIASLEAIVHEFILPIRENHKILKPKYATIIFANIEEILQVQKNFLVQLRNAAENTEARRFGAVLSHEAPSLKVYTTYINNYNEALSTLFKCQKKFPPFEKFLKEKLEAEGCHGLSLIAFLIMPIQRIPRYVLLFQDLLKHTTEKHVDYKPTQFALDEIKEVADYVNEEKRIAEDLQKLHEIESNLHGYSSLALKNRSFIKDGSLKVVDKKGEEPIEYQYMLFNDLLLFCAEGLSGTLGGFFGVGAKKLKVVHEMRLLNTEIIEHKDRHDLQNAFELKTKKVAIFITFSTAEEKAEWLDEFYKIRAKAPVIDHKK